MFIWMFEIGSRIQMDFWISLISFRVESFKCQTFTSENLLIIPLEVNLCNLSILLIRIQMDFWISLISFRVESFKCQTFTSENLLIIPLEVNLCNLSILLIRDSDNRQ